MPPIGAPALSATLMPTGSSSGFSRFGSEGDNPLNGLAHHPGRATLAASLAAQPPALDFAQRDYKVVTATIGWSSSLTT
ncbi:hypothetical protein BQ8794_30516 [Mesorhizobium prunaredense]|uniref:Uncharacterized protein n=1 Tax=Mesorhizobium prunaredense TaxID=1631249 RepID=A0A1R3VAX1_9HYPH|nr:hypothetical protein [Mesorhizobium prunaredense]SIT57067.1 hypothetical protein BQ8794_30516 [Mesorhizobium prunaredense]